MAHVICLLMGEGLAEACSKLQPNIRCIMPGIPAPVL